MDNFVNMFQSWIHDEVSDAFEAKGNLVERDANRIADLERRLLRLEGDFETRVGNMECLVDDIEERFGVDVQDYIKEYFSTARIKVTIDKEVI
jgi:hypothetical protein